MPKNKPSTEEEKPDLDTEEEVSIDEGSLPESDSPSAELAELISEPTIAAAGFEPPAQPASPPTPQPLSPSDERTWAMLAHLSVWANLITGVLGPVIALIIYLVFKDRSRYVAYQSMQAFVFQLVWWVGGGVLTAIAWTISGLLAAIIIGCCLMPFALLISLIPLGALVYGSIGGLETSQGKDFKYWLIGDWVRGIYTGK